MAVALRPGSAPRCLSCLRRYALSNLEDSTVQSSALRQQVRGKKKLPNHSDIVTVRLRKDVETFGRKGAFVPVPRGQMRNIWYPGGVAEYVTAPELRALRLKDTVMERDFQFVNVKSNKQRHTKSAAMQPLQREYPDPTKSVPDDIINVSAFQKKAGIERLSPQRSAELVELFVPPRLDFYRQPIVEEKEKEESEEPVPEPEKAPSYGSGAAADLLAARFWRPEEKTASTDGKSQAIYGSVSPLDVLQAVRAAMAENEEAQRVVLTEEDVQFVDLAETEGESAKVIKHTGDFVVEIKPRGCETTARRTVRVIPQEL